MKNYSIISYILLAAVMFSVSGCSKDPGIRITDQYTLWFSNQQGQRVLAGEGIDVLFGFSIIKTERYPVDSVKVVFDVGEGGGSLTVANQWIASDEVAKTTWSVGSGTFSQVLTASVYDLEGKFLSSHDLLVYAFRDNQWDEVTAGPELQIWDLAADTVNGVTFMTTYSKLYRQGTRFYTWEEVINPLFQNPDSPRTVEIDGNGIFYVSTSGGNIIRSNDHGVTWQACAKPWPDITTYVQAYVSNDDRLWAYTSDRPVRYSDDRGVTWHNAGADAADGGIGDIFRLRDGTLIRHGLNCCSLAISDDDGQTWTPKQAPEYSHKIYVSGDDEIFILASQGTGETIFRSVDRGVSFTHVHSVGVTFRSSYDNIFTRYGKYWYVAIPGFGIMKSADLIHYENYWRFNDLRTLYMDHNGVMIVRDKDFHSVWYHSSPD
ncbi:MAG: WD40/YVTN/BNR-like repeat-containing protein [Bacteroidales bacterium]